MLDNRGLWRGKRVDSEEWIEGYFAGYFLNERGENAPHILRSDNGDLEEVIPETLGECTTHPDKHGNLIFEGNIVEAYKYGEEKFVNSISFRNGCFWFGNWTFIEFLVKFRDYEVIGNIFDNPDLLKGGD